MEKLRISVAVIGHIPAEFDKRKIVSWKSELFSILGTIESYSFTKASDGPNWEFSDKALEEIVPTRFSGDFLVALVNVPLEDNWYSRRLSNNRIIFTFYELKQILDFSNVPLENVVLRILYAYTLYYKRNGGRIRVDGELINFTHDDTRGCLFDMNGVKTDIIYSCHEPIVCPGCAEGLKRDKVSAETIARAQKEIQRIRKPLYYRIAGFIKRHPIWSLVISAVSATAFGTIGSYLATLIYETLNRAAR